MSGLDEGRLFGRQRRANAGGRAKSYRVYVTEAEDAQLRALAGERSVTVPRLLFEAAVAPRVEIDTDRRAAIAEIFSVRRLMANIANNVNQLAKFANSEGRLPQEAELIVAEYRRAVPAMEAAARRLAGL